MGRASPFGNPVDRVQPIACRVVERDARFVFSTAVPLVARPSTLPSDAMPGPLVLENEHTGERLEISRFLDGAEECFHLKGSLPPKSEGPPLHVHFEEDEVGTVRRGVLSALVGGSRLEVGAGETATLPRGVPHRWWNEGDETLEFDGVVRPAIDLDRYLQAVFEVINAGPPGRPPLLYLAHVALRHRRTQSVLLMPRPIQGLFFRLLVALGTVLGRYRGDEWPGSPERCGGAPSVPRNVDREG